MVNMVAADRTYACFSTIIKQLQQINNDSNEKILNQNAQYRCLGSVQNVQGHVRYQKSNSMKTTGVAETIASAYDFNRSLTANQLRIAKPL